MYKIFKALLTIFWVGDILNMPMSLFNYVDTVLPINTMAWLLIWLCIPLTTQNIRHIVKYDFPELDLNDFDDGNADIE